MSRTQNRASVPATERDIIAKAKEDENQNIVRKGEFLLVGMRMERLSYKDL